jgi:ABC-2 type transport system ATP-binding protein
VKITEALVTRGLTKTYRDVRALDDFSLEAQAGEIVGLVGANGSGKTTFADVVAGVIRPDNGSVHVLGIDMLRAPRLARRHLGYAGQDSGLYFSASVKENLQLFGGLQGLRGAALRRAVAEVVGQMQLDAVMDRAVGVLSGGQRRRAHVATALLGAPRLLLLDEPTAGADPPTRNALLTAVRERARQGAAVVYTTHYLPELAELDATLAVIRQGRVLARGCQEDLLAGLPGELRVELAGPVPERLLGCGAVVDGELRLPTSDPARTLADLLASGHVPTSVDVRRASLDDLYQALDQEPVHAI